MGGVFLYIQQINQRIKLKHTPDLVFYNDEREDAMKGIDHLFEQIAQR